MCDEWPSIKYPIDFDKSGYDGVLEPGMMLCVEAYMGTAVGAEGIKLEEQVLITETGVENLSKAPFDDEMADSLLGTLPREGHLYTGSRIIEVVTQVFKVLIPITNPVMRPTAGCACAVRPRFRQHAAHQR